MTPPIETPPAGEPDVAGATVSDEELVHEIAVELNNEGAYCGDCDYESGLECPDCKRVCEGYARNVVLPRIKAAALSAGGEADQ